MGFRKGLLLVTLLLSGLLLSAVASAGSSVWKVSKGESYFYMGGTIHLLSESDYPLPKEFEQAYQDSSELIFETDLLDIETQAFQSKMAHKMMYQDERVLSSELDADIYAELEKAMVMRQLPPEQYSKFQPWAVSLMITMLEYQRFGMVPEYGLDKHFHGRSVTDGKDISGLESPLEQLEYLASFSNVSPNSMIKYTLQDLSTLPDLIKLMRVCWVSGNLEGLEESSNLEDMKTIFPEIYNTLVVKRNNDWMSKLPRLVDDHNIEFVLVGSLHLSGELGVLSQLKRLGFDVKQL